MNFEIRSLDQYMADLETRIERFNGLKEYDRLKNDIEMLKKHHSEVTDIRNTIFDLVRTKLESLKVCRVALRDLKDEMFQKLSSWCLPEFANHALDAIDNELNHLEDNLHYHSMYARCLFEYSYFLQTFVSAYWTKLSDAYIGRIIQIRICMASPSSCALPGLEQKTYWEGYIHLHAVLYEFEKCMRKREEKLAKKL